MIIERVKIHTIRQTPYALDANQLKTDVSADNSKNAFNLSLQGINPIFLKSKTRKVSQRRIKSALKKGQQLSVLKMNFGFQ